MYRNCIKLTFGKTIGKNLEELKNIVQLWNNLPEHVEAFDLKNFMYNYFYY